MEDSGSRTSRHSSPMPAPISARLRHHRDRFIDGEAGHQEHVVNVLAVGGKRRPAPGIRLSIMDTVSNSGNIRNHRAAAGAMARSSPCDREIANQVSA